MDTPSSDTPQPAQLPASPPPLSPRSGLDSLLSKLPGTAVQLYALHRLTAALLEALRSPPADDRWRWVLLSCVVVVVPSAVWSGFELARQFLNSKRT